MTLLSKFPASNNVLKSLKQFNRVNQFQFSSVAKKGSRNSIWKDYGELSKFRLSSLVVVTTGAGFICAGAPIDFYTMASACIGTMFCAASAGTFNQVFEKECDMAMSRTKNRPLPSGRVSQAHAAAFGAATGALGTGMLYALTNPYVAALGAFNIFLYAGPYTYSKRQSELNTWIGSVVGAIPPIMGWCAATGGEIIAAEPLALASILFLWQFPHFFALSWMHREDYGKGGFAMVPVNDPTGNRTANYIMEYSLYLTALPIATSVLGLTNYMFTIEGTAANMYLLYLAKKFKDDHTNANARRVFLCSLWYLPLLLAGYVFHSRMWNKNKNTQGIEQTIEEDGITAKISETKDYLKQICFHEMLFTKENATNSSPNLCPIVATDKAIENTIEKVDGVITEQVDTLKKTQ